MSAAATLTRADITLTARDLSVLAYAQSFTLWHYKTEEDPLARVLTAAYFAPAFGGNHLICAGDHMHIHAADGDALVTFARDGRPVVMARTGGVL